MDGEVGDRNRKIKKEEEEESGNSSTSAARANFQQFLPFLSLSLSLSGVWGEVHLPAHISFTPHTGPSNVSRKERRKQAIAYV